MSFKAEKVRFVESNDTLYSSDTQEYESGMNSMNYDIEPDRQW